MTRTKATKRYISLVIITLLFLALSLVGGVFYSRSHNNTQKTKSTPSYNNINVPTQTVTTEGKDIQVPTNVDANSIKNYTLVAENEKFKIRSLDGAYVITLYPIANTPNSTYYTDQLKEYKTEALAYLHDQGVDINKVSITYDPAEATNL